MAKNAELLSKETVISMLEESPFLKLGDVVYRILETGILTLELPPKSKLKINNIAEKLDVSATPVREAIEKLEEDGIVIAEKTGGSKYKTYTVFDIDDDDFQQLFVVRKAIEGMAAYLCAQRNWTVDIDALQSYIDEFTDRLHGYLKGEHTFLECGDSDRAFHTAIVKFSGNKYLEDTYFRLAKKLDYLSIRTCEFVASGSDKDELNKLYVQHQAVLNAIKMGFPELAREAAQTHIDFCIENSFKSRYISPGAAD